MNKKTITSFRSYCHSYPAYMRLLAQLEAFEQRHPKAFKRIVCGFVSPRFARIGELVRSLDWLTKKLRTRYLIAKKEVSFFFRNGKLDFTDFSCRLLLGCAPSVLTFKDAASLLHISVGNAGRIVSRLEFAGIYFLLGNGKYVKFRGLGV